jgi:hypothetical protein
MKTIRMMLSRWIFFLGMSCVYLASLLDETETAGMLAYFYRDLIASAKASLSKVQP